MAPQGRAPCNQLRDGPRGNPLAPGLVYFNRGDHDPLDMDKPEGLSPHSYAVRRGKQDRLDDIKLEITQSGGTIEVDANHRLVERRNDNVVETDFDIQVPARTRLDIKTFSAPVTVIGVSESQKIDGFSSDIRIEASQWGDGNSLDINTFSGDVNLRLPDNARGEIDFNSFSGRFESDLPVTLTNSSRRNFRGALNGVGSGDFRLKTFSGSVSIRR